MREASEVECFRSQLELCEGQCWVCLRFERISKHDVDECPERGTKTWDDVVTEIRKVTDEMFGKRRFERFSGCFECGIPQAICESWTEGADGGRFQRARGGVCRYKGILAGMYGAGFGGQTTQVRQEMEKEARKFGGKVNGAGQEQEWYKWLGKRVIWGGMETNLLCRVWYWIGNEFRVK